MPADPPTTSEAAPAPTSVKPPSRWSDPRIVYAGFILMTGLNALIGQYQANLAARQPNQRVDYAYDALSAAVRDNSRGDEQQSTDLRNLKNSVAALYAALQVSSPAPGATGTAAAAPAVVLTEPGMLAPPRRILRPIASSLPPLPAVSANPAPPSLPRSVDSLLEDR